MNLDTTSYASAPVTRRARDRLLRRGSDLLYRHANFYLLLLLLPPLLWFGVVYLGSLFSLLLQSIYRFDDFTMGVTRDLTFENYLALVEGVGNLDVVLRTTGMACCVTMMSVLLAFPVAYYMARYTKGWKKGAFYVAVMLPMWASYIVKVYAWTVILAQGGILYWFVDKLRLRFVLDALLHISLIGGDSLSTSNVGRFIVFTYIWLPFMILPIQAAIERIPVNLLNASADLGADPRQTFRTIILPLAFPGIAAGSIFTFSLTLGDYIIPQLVGPSGLYIGTMVYTMQGSIGNIPMAAAFTLVPMLLIGIYLVIAKKLGAFDAL